MLKKNVVSMTEDVVKVLTIAIIYHLFVFSIDNGPSLLEESTLKGFIYLIVGVIVFHVIIKPYLKIDFKNKKKHKNKKHKNRKHINGK